MRNPIKAFYDYIRGEPADGTPLKRKRPLPDSSVNVQSSRFGRDLYAMPMDRAIAYEISTTAKACIAFRTNQMRRVQWHVMDHNGDVIDDSPFHNMLKYHHKLHRQDFFERWITMLLIHGNVYMEKLWREDNNLPGGIRILNSAYIEPHITLDILQYYLYDPPNTTSEERIPRDDILHDIIPSSLSDHRGKSPMDRAMEAINLDRKSLNLLRSYLDYGDKPMSIFTLDANAPNLTEEEIDELVEYWKDQAKGDGGAYGVRFLPGALNIHSFSIEKPDLIYSFEMANIICREYAIDPALIGIIDQTDSSNKPASALQGGMETRFINALTSAVVPDLRHIEDFVNFHILPFLSPEGAYTFKWNYDEIDRMIRYSDKAVDQLRSDYLAGVISLNEYRKARFFPELPPEAGDQYSIPKGYIRVNVDDMEKLAIAIDPSLLDKLMVNDIEHAHALAASSSPDFNQVAMTSEEKPGDNRYPVQSNM